MKAINLKRYTILQQLKRVKSKREKDFIILNKTRLNIVLKLIRNSVKSPNQKIKENYEQKEISGYIQQLINNYTDLNINEDIIIENESDDIEEFNSRLKKHIKSINSHRAVLGIADKPAIDIINLDDIQIMEKVSSKEMQEQPAQYQQDMQKADKYDLQPIHYQYQSENNDQNYKDSYYNSQNNYQYSNQDCNQDYNDNQMSQLDSFATVENLNKEENKIMIGSTMLLFNNEVKEEEKKF